jgi:hypothetical protein
LPQLEICDRALRCLSSFGPLLPPRPTFERQDGLKVVPDVAPPAKPLY